MTQEHTCKCYEYRRQDGGRRLDQQKIANLIAISTNPFLTIDQRRRAAHRALVLLDESWPDAETPTSDKAAR